MKMLARLGLAAAVLVPAVPTAAIDDDSTPVAATPSLATPWLATFDGEVIDLRQGWGRATACHSDGITTECFATRVEMERSIAATTGADPVLGDPVGDPVLGDQVEDSGPDGVVAGFAGGPSSRYVCSSTLRLYTGLSYSGSVLALSSQGQVLNLALWGFSNVTSSYKVGACSSIFYDGTAGNGSVYPGSTGAYAQYTSMWSGWNDRISSVFIY